MTTTKRYPQRASRQRNGKHRNGTPPAQAPETVTVSLADLRDDLWTEDAVEIGYCNVQRSFALALHVRGISSDDAFRKLEVRSTTHGRRPVNLSCEHHADNAGFTFELRADEWVRFYRALGRAITQAQRLGVLPTPER